MAHAERLFTCRITVVAIADASAAAGDPLRQPLTAIARSAPKPYQSGQIRRVASGDEFLRKSCSNAGEMRRILLSTAKVTISAALLYLALRKVNLSELFSRFTITSLFWIIMLL